MKLTGQAVVLSATTYKNNKGDDVQVVNLGDYATFEKLTIFNVPTSLIIPSQKTEVQFEITVREYKNKAGFNQIALYLNNIEEIDR